MIRARSRLSQLQVAEALGCSQNAIGTWERGVSQPQVDTLLGICKLFGGISSDWLIGRSDYEHGLPVGMFLVDLDAIEDPREGETLAQQIPQRPALMSYDQVQKIYKAGAKNVRRGKR